MKMFKNGNCFNQNSKYTLSFGMSKGAKAKSSGQNSAAAGVLMVVEKNVEVKRRIQSIVCSHLCLKRMTYKCECVWVEGPKLRPKFYGRDLDQLAVENVTQ